MKKQAKPIVATKGEDHVIYFERNIGYSLYLRVDDIHVNYIGSFDTITEAQAERDRIIYEQLKRAA